MKKLSLLLAVSSSAIILSSCSSKDKEVELVTEQRVQPIGQNIRIARDDEADLSVRTSVQNVAVDQDVLPVLSQPKEIAIPEVTFNTPKVATQVTAPAVTTQNVTYSTPQVTTTMAAPTVTTNTYTTGTTSSMGSFQIPAGVQPKVVNRQVYQVQPGQPLPYRVPANTVTKVGSGTVSAVTGQPITVNRTTSSNVVTVPSTVGVTSGYYQQPTNVLTTSGVYPGTTTKTTVTETVVTEQQ